MELKNQLPTTSIRNRSIDTLRGIAMILMALDHTRDFFTSTGTNPTDLSRVSATLFLTRWVTHFCAPIFIFLAGTGACLAREKFSSTGSLSSFLFRRGLWIVLLEVTIIRFGWHFSLSYQHTELQVFWAIGISMILLSLWIYLPSFLIAVIGGTLVFGHNAFDLISAENFGSVDWLWHLLHKPGILLRYGDISITVFYPLIPWIGVMALGYAFGILWKSAAKQRARLCLLIGLGAVLIFVALRCKNIYGDPNDWIPQKNLLYTILSFVNAQKYPPSLDYLLITLGGALLILAALEACPSLNPSFLSIFGRVPLFYYILHLYWIHLLAVLFPNAVSLNSLHVVYTVWLFVVSSLYFPSRWFAGVKQQYRHPLLSYL